MTGTSSRLPASAPTLPFFGCASSHSATLASRATPTSGDRQAGEPRQLGAASDHLQPHSWRSKAPVRLTPRTGSPAIDSRSATNRQYGETDTHPPRLTSIDKLVDWTPKTRPHRALFDDRWQRPDGFCPPGRLGTLPLTCLHEEGRAADRSGLPVEGRDGERPGSSPPSSKRAPISGYEDGFKHRCWTVSSTPTLRPGLRRCSTCGSTAARPMPSCCATAPTGPRTASAMSILEGEPTSIAAGSIPRSLQACGTKGRGALSRRGHPWVHAGREGHERCPSRSATPSARRGGQAIRRRYPAAVGVAQTDYTADQRIGPEILKGVADSYRGCATPSRPAGSRWRI